MINKIGDSMNNEFVKYKSELQEKLKKIKEIEQIEYRIEQCKFFKNNLHENLYSKLVISVDKEFKESLDFKIDKDELEEILAIYIEQQSRKLNINEANLSFEMSKSKTI